MKLKIKQATKKGYIEIENGGAFSYALPKSETRRGRVIDQGRISPTLDTGCQIGVVEEMKDKDTIGSRGVQQIGNLFDDKERNFKNPQAGRVYSVEGISPTLNTMQGGNMQPKISDGVRIRKLTPKECFRLQGFPDDYYERAAAVNSDSQLYKQAGNSVTVNVIYEIAKRLKEIEEADK